ncbi:DUF1654 domain-containing protein [Pseudomonas cremoricolorata]|uniref:DUF1654 domain-containing protein n=1 Tax=Pseudomonas cremoricolorata TaxID=157783 RepID=A0A089WQ94_9PSED|nr:DUF1654 domain-containing protein [Pseudomonas cremoricolorata]AIR90751.1 hypothetical protein LK03_16400 [Pseudomonas cremoricolorata]
MATQWTSTPTLREEMTGVERLSLRISSMINHPVAQMQRWVTIHPLDSDAQADWQEVLGQLDETPELQLQHHADGTVTVRWQRGAGALGDGERDGDEDSTATPPF